MLEIQEIKEITFAKYGSSLDPLSGAKKPEDLGAERVLFFPDRMLQTFATTNLIAFCPLIIKPRELVIVDAERHSFTEEVLGGFTEDVCFHVLPAQDGGPDLEKMEVFRLPAGWWVRLKRGVWHKAPFVLGNKATCGTVVLPPHTYTNDCEVVEFSQAYTIVKGD